MGWIQNAHLGRDRICVALVERWPAAARVELGLDAGRRTQAGGCRHRLSKEDITHTSGNGVRAKQRQAGGAWPRKGVCMGPQAQAYKVAQTRAQPCAPRSVQTLGVCPHQAGRLKAEVKRRRNNERELQKKGGGKRAGEYGLTVSRGEVSCDRNVAGRATDSSMLSLQHCRHVEV
eukprot:6190699-Pleurochrysis_carterae.AAC.2